MATNIIRQKTRAAQDKTRVENVKTSSESHTLDHARLEQCIRAALRILRDDQNLRVKPGTREGQS